MALKLQKTDKITQTQRKYLSLHTNYFKTDGNYTKEKYAYK